MVERGEQLTLAPELAEDLGGIHAVLHHLDGDLALVSLIATAREPNRAHTASGDAAFQFVGTGLWDARHFARGVLRYREYASQVRRGVIEKCAGLVVIGEQ